MPQLDSLGLKENPFKNSTEQRYFYADQNRAQILESTEHLIEYSNNVQVVIGPPGIGKSHFLESLASRIDNNWRIAIIKDAGQFDTLSLIQGILSSFGAIPDEEMELLETLETQLAEIIQLGFKPVLFIDNAQALSSDSIRFLLQLSQQKQNDEPYLNIVLFATTEITELLQVPELRDFRDIIHIATLAHLDKEGVSGYLRHKMAVAGFDRESPFTPRIVESIYRDSEGVPEKINFFASKFLASSGKGDDYIESDFDQLEPEFNRQVNEMAAAQESDLMTTLRDDELQDHRTDRAEEQIGRLAEKFEEIENMGEASDDFSFDNELSDKEEMAEDFMKEPSASQYEDNELKSLGVPKFIIPIALIGIILLAIWVINTVFERSDQTGDEQASNEKIELLPLELPAEKTLLQEQSPEPESAPEPEMSLQPEKSPIVDNTAQASKADTEAETELELVEVDDSELNTAQPAATEQTLTEAVTQPESQIEPEVESATVRPGPELRAVAEPVIGSSSRQDITIMGNNLEKNISLVVVWGEQKKEFSEKLTPKQWRYENKTKIKLHLTTGIQPQQWQVYAKNADGQQSKTIHFDVLKPFNADLTVKRISPNPVTGSDKRQAVIIIGQGFSKQTVIELKWGNNKKQFSSRLTPNQFEFVSANAIKLFVTTGKKERQWQVLVKNPTNGKTSSAVFAVVAESSKVKTAASVSSLKEKDIKDEHWLQQQPNTNFTIQLFASHNKQAIEQLIKKYSLKGDIARFKTQRNGQNWYSMTYGNYASKQAANAAVAKLHKDLSKPEPWVRSFESIKKQLNLLATMADKKTTESGLVTSRLPQSVSVQAREEVRGEAWVWTQNPADFTVQLLALSTEQALKAFIKQHQITTEAVYFQIKRDGKPLYVLTYGTFADKKSAEQSKEQLARKIKGSKPWVRSFSEIHGLMSAR